MHIHRGSPRENQINEGKPLDTPDLRHGQKVKYNFNILVVCAAPFMISTSWLDPISCLNFGEIKCLCSFPYGEKEMKKNKSENLMQRALTGWWSGGWMIHFWIFLLLEGNPWGKRSSAPNQTICISVLVAPYITLIWELSSQSLLVPDQYFTMNKSEQNKWERFINPADMLKAFCQRIWKMLLIFSVQRQKIPFE